MHETVELIKALAWPSVVLYIVIKFQSQIASLLSELPGIAKRLQSAQALGMEIKLETIDQKLPVAEQEAQSLSLPRTPEPKPSSLQ